MFWWWIAFVLIVCGGAWRVDRMMVKRRNEHGYPVSRRVYKRRQ